MTLLLEAESRKGEQYETLAAVLQRAYEQASSGKGKERHADDEPFEQQVICRNARKFGVGAPLAQAVKKLEESMRLPTRERREAERLGAINYIAAAIAVDGEQPNE